MERDNRCSVAAHFIPGKSHIEEMMRMEQRRAQLRRGVGPIPAKEFGGIIGRYCYRSPSKCPLRYRRC
jgi:hypothetical protein